MVSIRTPTQLSVYSQLWTQSVIVNYSQRSHLCRDESHDHAPDANSDLYR